MSQETKTKRLASLDARIQTASRRGREARESAEEWAAAAADLRQEREWLQSAPVSDPDTDEQEGPPA